MIHPTAIVDSGAILGRNVAIGPFTTIEKDVAIGDDGKPSLHVHIVLGLSDGSTRGGHLLAGTVRPTLEVVLTKVPVALRRKKRADLGIALIDLAATRG